MEKSNLCLRCINWDRRPEEGPGERMGYCIARRKVVGPHTECEYYQLRTADSVASLNRKIYGNFEENMDDMEF